MGFTDKEKKWILKHRKQLFGILKQKKEISPEERKKMLSSFMLMFPTVIIAVIGLAVSASFLINAIIVMLIFYQLMGLRAFIEDYYKKY